MDIVNKHNQLSELKVLRTLTDIERRAVISFYALDNANNIQQDIAVQMVQTVKEQFAWIRCDCRDDEVALLFPRLTHTGLVTLVRPCPLRQIPHDPSCAFYFSEQESLAGKDTATPSVNYCLLKTDKPKTDTKAEPNALSYAKKNETLPALTGIFIKLLAQSDAFKLSNRDFPSFNRIASKIKQFAIEQPLWKDAPIHLADVLLTDVKKRVPYFYRLRSEGRFDLSHLKQGFILTLVTEKQSKHLICSDGTMLEITGSIDVIGDEDSPIYLALVLCAESAEGNGFFVCYRASLVSVHSEKIPLLVASQEHRMLLKRLISWRQYWRTKEFDFEIHCPVSLDLTNTLVPRANIFDLETGKVISITTDTDDSGDICFNQQQSIKDFNISVSKALWASE